MASTVAVEEMVNGLVKGVDELVGVVPLVV
jgi:hypothetical protein